MLKNTKDIKSIDKCWRKVRKALYYELQFTDSARIMAGPLSNFVDNVAERSHKIECKNEHNMWSMGN